MTNLTDLTTSQLRRIIGLKQEIEAIQARIDSIAAGDGEPPAPLDISGPQKRHMSASARAKIAAAQRARWARVQGTTATASATKKKDGRSSPAFRAKMAAAARARWKKAKAAGKRTL